MSICCQWDLYIHYVTWTFVFKCVDLWVRKDWTAIPAPAFRGVTLGKPFPSQPLSLIVTWGCCESLQREFWTKLTPEPGTRQSAKFSSVSNGYYSHQSCFPVESCWPRWFESHLWAPSLTQTSQNMWSKISQPMYAQPSWILVACLLCPPNKSSWSLVYRLWPPCPCLPTPVFSAYLWALHP